MTEREWINLGKKRILSILKTYIACTAAQLEMKISEAGPTNQRVEPIVLRDSRKELLDEDLITSNNSTGELFYLLKNSKIHGNAINGRIKKISEIHTVYTAITGTLLFCGNVLEYIIQNAINSTNQYHFLASTYTNTPNGIEKSINFDVNQLNGIKLPNNSSLDIMAFHMGTGIPIGIEIKNKHSWKYGDNYEIWYALYKCALLGVLPIFITRKISDVAKMRMFHKIGLLGMETQFQYIHPSQEEIMKDVVDKKLLGFSDIKFSIDAPDYMVKYFNVTIPDNIKEYYEKFISYREILLYYCDDMNLASESLRGYHRTRVYNEFLREIE